jgi:hypothetical protein
MTGLTALLGLKWHIFKQKQLDNDIKIMELSRFRYGVIMMSVDVMYVGNYIKLNTMLMKVYLYQLTLTAVVVSFQ